MSRNTLLIHDKLCEIAYVHIKLKLEKNPAFIKKDQ